MMLYNDLREWITEVEKFGELRRIPGVDWDLEMGRHHRVVRAQ